MNCRHFGFTFCILLSTTPLLKAATRLDAMVNPLSVAADYQFSPDGRFLVVRGAAPNDGPAELYSLAASGGIPTRLSANLASDRSISAWELSPDGEYVVYFADQDVPGLNEVFVAPMPAGNFYKVNEALVDAGATAGKFAGVSGSHVAHIAGKVTGPFTGTFYELFSVPTIGGESIPLSGPMVNGGDVHHLVVDSTHGLIAYLADQERDEKFELYGVPAAGGEFVKLNSPIDDFSDIVKDALAFSPDGSRVIYQMVQQPENRFELYSVPAVGGEAVRLHPSLPTGGDVTLGSPRFTPDGSRIVYHADQNADELFEVFSVPAGGGPAVQLNGPLTLLGAVNAAGIQVSPDSSRVLYTADQLVYTQVELFSAPIAGGPSVKLSGEMIAGGDVVDDAAFSPDGARVLFRADRRVDGVVELFSTPSAGGMPQLLNAPLPLGGNVIRAAFSPDGGEVVYLADQEMDETFELFAVPAAGGEVRKLSGPLVSGGDVLDWKFSPDGSQLVYRADQEVDGLFELFSVDWNFSSAPLEGDFNGDGAVDAADYTKWRDGFGSLYTANDYATWKSNFGRSSGSAASAPGSAGSNVATVPEPATFFLAALAAIARGISVRRQSSQSCSANRAGTYSSVT